MWLAVVATVAALLLGIGYSLFFRSARAASQQKEKAHRFLQQAHAARYHKKDTSTAKLIIVLDLDECLVHVNKDGKKMAAPPSIESFVCHFPALRHGINPPPQQQQYIACQVFLRPGWKDFLEPLLSQPDRYEVHLFTASERDYAMPILAEMERRLADDGGTKNTRNDTGSESPKSRFAHCWYRDSCRKWQYMNHTFTFKDLAVVHGNTPFIKRWWTIKNDYFDRRMKRTVLVDDDSTNFTDNPDHGIPVRPFVADRPEDDTLSKVSRLLDELEQPTGGNNDVDVRPLLRQRFGLAEAFRQAEKQHPSFVPNQWAHVMDYVQALQL